MKSVFAFAFVCVCVCKCVWSFGSIRRIYCQWLCHRPSIPFMPGSPLLMHVCYIYWYRRDVNGSKLELEKRDQSQMYYICGQCIPLPNKYTDIHTFILTHTVTRTLLYCMYKGSLQCSHALLVLYLNIYICSVTSCMDNYVYYIRLLTENASKPIRSFQNL